MFMKFQKQMESESKIEASLILCDLGVPDFPENPDVLFLLPAVSSV